MCNNVLPEPSLASRADTAAAPSSLASTVATTPAAPAGSSPSIARRSNPPTSSNGASPQRLSSALNSSTLPKAAHFDSNFAAMAARTTPRRCDTAEAETGAAGAGESDAGAAIAAGALEPKAVAKVGGFSTAHGAGAGVAARAAAAAERLGGKRGRAKGGGDGSSATSSMSSLSDSPTSDRLARSPEETFDEEEEDESEDDEASEGAAEIGDAADVEASASLGPPPLADTAAPSAPRPTMEPTTPAAEAYRARFTDSMASLRPVPPSVALRFPRCTGEGVPVGDGPAEPAQPPGLAGAPTPPSPKLGMPLASTSSTEAPCLQRPPRVLKSTHEHWATALPSLGSKAWTRYLPPPRSLFTVASKAPRWPADGPRMSTAADRTKAIAFW
mmetsp:Transcript_531/g.1554  ORF Transcript_531/g.1554 Transcript_531/m.1554 type:complete len:387 (-) Transcript_531:150-1310(-)